MDEQELTVVTIMGYGSVSVNTTISTSYNIDGIDDEGPEEDPASDWDKNVEFYARDAETGEWEAI